MKLYAIQYYSELSHIDPECGSNVVWFTSKRAAIAEARRLKREVVSNVDMCVATTTLYSVRQYQSISVHRVDMPVTRAALAEALNSIEARGRSYALERGTVWKETDGGE